MKAELDKKASEHEEQIAHLTSKHNSELNAVNYQLQDSESKRSELTEELSKLQGKITEQLRMEELQEQIAKLQSQIEAAEHTVTTLTEENKILQEESHSVCLMRICFLVVCFYLHVHFSFASLEQDLPILV